MLFLLFDFFFTQKFLSSENSRTSLCNGRRRSFFQWMYCEPLSKIVPFISYYFLVLTFLSLFCQVFPYFFCKTFNLQVHVFPFPLTYVPQNLSWANKISSWYRTFHHLLCFHKQPGQLSFLPPTYGHSQVSETLKPTNRSKGGYMFLINESMNCSKLRGITTMYFK